MQIGYVLICNSDSFDECLKNKRFSCSGEQVEVAREIEDNAIVFLRDLDKQKLIGPFTAVDQPNKDLQAGTWRSYVEKNQFSENIMVQWERLHVLDNPEEKVNFLSGTKSCKLSSLQTQELLNLLNEAPLYIQGS